jgi:hypothetical protein
MLSADLAVVEEIVGKPVVECVANVDPANVAGGNAYEGGNVLPNWLIGMSIMYQDRSIRAGCAYLHALDAAQK